MLKFGHLSNVGLVTVDVLSHADTIPLATYVAMRLEINYRRRGTRVSAHYFSALSNYEKERGTERSYFFLAPVNIYKKYICTTDFQRYDSPSKHPFLIIKKKNELSKGCDTVCGTEKP